MGLITSQLLIKTCQNNPGGLFWHLLRKTLQKTQKAGRYSRYTGLGDLAQGISWVPCTALNQARRLKTIVCPGV